MNERTNGDRHSLQAELEIRAEFFNYMRSRVNIACIADGLEQARVNIK